MRTSIQLFARPHHTSHAACNGSVIGVVKNEGRIVLCATGPCDVKSSDLEFPAEWKPSSAAVAESRFGNGKRRARSARVTFINHERISLARNRSINTRWKAFGGVLFSLLVAHHGSASPCGGAFSAGIFVL